MDILINTDYRKNCGITNTPVGQAPRLPSENPVGQAPRLPSENPPGANILNSSTTPISTYLYTNDLLGRRSEISQGGTAFQQLRLGENKVEVAYNTRSEVIGATIKGDETQSFHYAYDSIGNRTSSVAEIRGRKSEVSYQANSLNQYEQINVKRSGKPAENPETSLPSTFAPSDVSEANYDLDGNLLSDHHNTYTWNSENRLSRVESKDGKTRVDYYYDYQGRRTIRQTFHRTKVPDDFKLKAENLYLYDGWNLLAETSRNHGAVVAADSRPPKESAEPKTGEQNQKPELRQPTITESVRYHTWGRDLSGTLQGAGGVGGLLAITEQVGMGVRSGNSQEPASSRPSRPSQRPGGSPSPATAPAPSSPAAAAATAKGKAETSNYFPLYDANGNIGQLIDETGVMKAAYSYDAFGNVTGMVGELAAENPWRFSTKPVEEVTGWSYYGFRYYMPETGRWASRDPIEERGGVNLYGFVGNGAVNWIDYLGADTITIIGSPSLSKDDPNKDGNLIDRHDKNPWNFLNVGLRRLSGPISNVWDPTKNCCKYTIIIFIYEPGYTRRFAQDGNGDLRETVDSWKESKGENERTCIDVRYVGSANALLDSIKQMDPESITHAEYIGHSSTKWIMVEYGSLAFKNDGRQDANKDGKPDGVAKSTDKASVADFSAAFAGKFAVSGTFHHYGCFGAQCARQFHDDHDVGSIGADGRTNFDPAGAAGRPEMFPSGNYQGYGMGR